ncbi:heavy metal translocating P-type ATPase [Actinobacteria bacterium IMCC25003]|nr:heavy metal translocating P-type ATPase [Actinobacteria bacterium IMCC25003]
MEDIQIDLAKHRDSDSDYSPSESAPLLAQTFAVTGMTCSACVNSIERTLNEMDGVSASVNFASETVHVLAPANLPAELVIKKIKAAGYGATLLSNNSDPALHRKGAARALIFAILLAVPSIAISMVMSWHPPINDWLIALFNDYSIPLPPHAHHLFASWLVLVISAPLIFIVAFPIHRAAIRNIFHPTMDTLVSLGSLSAYIWSVYATYTAQGDVYTEVSAGVLLFVILGRFLESRAKRSAGSALSTLLALGEKEVAVLRNGTEVLIPISHLVIGDEFVVKPGTRIATDGVVISGQSTVDNSLITGESTPIEINPGMSVIGSALNNNGRLIVRATRIGSDTELARITAMVVTAQGTKAPIQALADKIASIFVPVVTVLAIGTFEGWYYFGDKSLTYSISTAITVLVIACPCALGLATPVALLVASGRGALRGIVIRHPRVLEASHSITTVVLDKTGTLTDGAMKVQQVSIPVSAQKVFGASFATLINEKSVLSSALALESQSNHPVSQAIVSYCIARGAQQLPVTDFNQTPGVGVAGRVRIGDQSPVVIIGSPESVAHSSVPFNAEIESAIRDAQSHSFAVAVLAWDGVAIAVFAAGDVIKKDAAATIAALQSKKIDTWLLTGDNPEAAAKVGASVGISADHIIALAKPEDKLAKISSLQSEGKRVLMVGDGVNDAAALAQANLSIAMGTGTDTAIATADITIMRPELMSVVDALALSKRTLRTIKVNLGWAFAYNAVGIPIAAAGLMSPMYAAAAMALSSLFVVTNSLRIK